MNEFLVIVIIALGLLGLCLGSFAGATMWRLRARQLVEDKADGEKVDKKEFTKLRPLTESSFTKDRSRCLHCGHTLAWYDLLPLISWVSTGGKCRYCGRFIGWFEPVVELATAIIFIVAYLYWPYSLFSAYDIAVFILWLISSVMLVILFAYDLRWFLLPNRVIFPLIFIAGMVAVLRLYSMGDILSGILTLAGAVGILSGLYLLLWVVSKGKWIGFGDIKLGLALALLLGDWGLAFIALFAANLIGVIIVIPGLLSGKLTRSTHVPFGPLLIAGYGIAFFVGHAITAWYSSLLY